MRPFLILFLLTLFTLGIIVLVWPDDNDRLFSLSDAHGPSVLDAVGLLMIFVPYSILIGMAWNRKERLMKYQASGYMSVGLFLGGLGTGLILASVINDYSYWWVFGSAILFAVQVPLFFVTLRNRNY